MRSEFRSVSNQARQKLITKMNDNDIQSTLVISKSKGPSGTLRDIRTSTYQICRIEENTNRITEEQFLLLSTIFCYLTLDFYVETRIRFSLRDKRLFEITEVEITRVDCSL